MVGLRLLLGLPLALAAVALLVWTQLPGETVLREDPPGVATPESLAATFGSPAAPSGEIVPSCGSCHYGWDVPFEVNATRTNASATTGAYRIALAPVSGYTLAAAFAAPVAPGEAAPAPRVEDRRVDVVTGAGPKTVPLAVPAGSAAVYVEVYNERIDRPDVRVHVDAPAGRVEGDGSRAWKSLLVTGADPLPATLDLRVAVEDAAYPQTTLTVRYRAFPASYQALANGTRGAPLAFQFHAPLPGQPGAPGSFHVEVAVVNPHPVERQPFGNVDDAAYYVGDVSAATAAAPVLPRTWTEAEKSAAWNGRDRVTLTGWTLDATHATTRNARGEYSFSPLPALAYQELPGEAKGLPPGTTHVVATLTWEKRTPVSPDPVWLLSLSQRPLPDFRYPEPTSLKPGERVDVIPITPQEWEDRDPPWFQAYPVLAFDKDGRAVFDGRYTFRLEAVRSQAS